MAKIATNSPYTSRRSCRGPARAPDCGCDSVWAGGQTTPAALSRIAATQFSGDRGPNHIPGASFADLAVASLGRRREAHAETFGHVVLIQFAAAVDSLWLVPGFGQPSGAVMLRIGIVMIRSGSQAANSYCGRFLLKPVTASL